MTENDEPTQEELDASVRQIQDGWATDPERIEDHRQQQAERDKFQKEKDRELAATLAAAVTNLSSGVVGKAAMEAAAMAERRDRLAELTTLARDLMLAGTSQPDIAKAIFEALQGDR
jgi:hypothetical protein